MTDPNDPYEGLTGFLDQLKSSSSTPGGGAVAGLCGALAGALAQMVASLTLGRKKYAAVQEDFAAAADHLDTAISRFVELMKADVEAFDGFMQAWKLPRESDDDKTRRKTAIRAATITAAEVPLETLELARDLLPLVRLAAEKGNQNLVSDAGMAALLITCAAKSAAMNVKINLVNLGDDDAKPLAKRLDAALEPTLEEAARIEARVDATWSD